MRGTLRRLEGVRGTAGTTCISVYVAAEHPAQLSKMSQTLLREMTAAAQIKSSATRHAVQASLRALRAHLQRMRSLPPEGLALFACADDASGSVGCGVTWVTPIKPVRRTRYWCDSSFDLAPLRDSLQAHDTYGYVVVGGDGALLATQRGAETRVLASWSVSLPKKHGRGGQSALRVARSRI